MEFCAARFVLGDAVSFLLVQSTRYNRSVNMDLRLESCCLSNESHGATHIAPADMIR